MTGQGTSLRRYLLTRLALVLPMVFILLTFVFLLMRVAPGDPISAALGGHAPPSVIDQIKHQLGFDKPIYEQYGDYLWDIVRGRPRHDDHRPPPGDATSSASTAPRRSS